MNKRLERILANPVSAANASLEGNDNVTVWYSRKHGTIYGPGAGRPQERMIIEM